MDRKRVLIFELYGGGIFVEYFAVGYFTAVGYFHDMYFESLC